ncbi:3D domain-containing protein [Bacillota bacterium LX-D]|nr:3D domain-containing protein [Bacillota bacterium LX-D]
MLKTANCQAPPGKKILLLITAFFLLCGMSLTCYAQAVKTVTVVQGVKKIKIRTLARNVQGVLRQQKIQLSKYDLVEPGEMAKIQEGSEVRIYKAIPVIVSADGKSKTIMVAKPTREKVLTNSGIRLGSLDQVTDNLNTSELPKKLIVTRITEKKVVKYQKVDFVTKRQPKKSLVKGQTKVLQEGRPGVMQKIVIITYKNGQEQGRKIISSAVIKAPQTKLIAYGTKNPVVATASRSLEGRKMLFMEATGYTHTGNRTATGIMPYRGIIAVDPDVIPLGTKLYVEGYGYCVAQDTGGAINGHRIDLFYDSVNEALNWGRKVVKVYILH